MEQEPMQKKKREWKFPKIKNKQVIILLVTLCIGAGAIGIMLSQLSSAKGYKKGYDVDEKLLLDEEKASFDFLWDHTNQDITSPGYGLVLDRAKNDKMASVASVGFALTGYGIGVENGWITKDEGYQRTLGTLKMLYNNAEQVEGFFYHFLDVKTAKRYEKVEVSMIDTAIAINGALFAGEYFEGEVKELADKIYKRVNWNWYRNDATNKFYMEFLPEKKEHTGSWGVYAEQFMAYFLSAASPTHAAPADMIYEIDRSSTTWAGMEPYISSPNNSIFTYQFSQAWFDLENLVDNEGYDWYHNSVVATLASRQYSIDTRHIFKTFNENSWGLTACDGPFGYSGQYGANPEKAVDGTIPPCGPSGSAAYTPNLVSDALTYMKTIDSLYDEKWGFKDAFNQEGDGTIVIDDYLSIDKGISMLMIENQRTGLVWDTMNQNEYVIEGKKLTGFSSANTKLIEDGDNVNNHYGIKDEGLKVKKAKQAYQGNQGLMVQMDESSGKMTFKLKGVKLDEIVSSGLQVYVSGQAKLSATFFDRSGKELTSSSQETVDSKDYKKVILDIKNSKDYYKDIKSVELTIESDQKQILIDEIGFTNQENMVRNATISERPYVDGELYAYFDYLGDKPSDKQLFAYQWKISDSMKDEFKDIEDATKSIYKPTKSDVGKYLKVEITPVDEDGKSIGISSISKAVSKVSEKMPKVSADIEEVILKHKGRVPDVINGDTFSVLKYWFDGGQSVYEIGDAGEKLITKFEKKNMEYPYMMRNITVQDISKFNKLVINASGDTNLLLKLEERDGTPLGEIELDLNKNGGYYEWDISQHREMLKNMGNILIFAKPGEMNGKGLFEFTQLEFSVAKATKNVIYSKGQIPSPTNYYRGQTSTFDFNHYWVDGGDNVYKISEKPKGVNTFVYKKNNSAEWANAKTHISGKLEQFNKVVLELTGPKGAEVLFKVEGTKGSAESGIVKLHEGINYIEINLSTLTKAQRNALKDVLFFAAPNSKNGSGTIKVSSAYFSREAYLGNAFVHRYSGNKADFTFNECWYDSGDGVYNIKCSNHTTSVNFRKDNDQEYAYMESLVKGKINDFKYANFLVKGTKGKTVIFKLEGSQYNQEYKHIFTGSYDKVSVILDKKQNANSISKVLIMAEPGEKNGVGTFILDKAYFSTSKLSPLPDPMIHHYNGNLKDFIISKGFEDSQDKVYQIKTKNNRSTISFDKTGGNEWSNFYVNVEGKLSDFKYLYIDVLGERGQQLLMKLETKGYLKEHIVQFNGQRQRVAVEINNQDELDQLEKILMFAQPGKTGKGSFDIYGVTFSNTEPDYKKVNEYSGNKEDFHFNQYWNDDGDGAHTITTQDNKTHVDVFKTAGQEYSYMYTNINGKFSDFNKLVFTAKGEKGQQILLKIKTATQVRESWLTFTGNEDYFEIDLKGLNKLDDLKQIIVYGFGGKIQNGQFDIHDIYMTYEEPIPETVYNEYPGDKKDFKINQNLLSNESGKYNFTYNTDNVNIATNKTSGDEWQYYYSPVKGKISDFDYIDMVVEGTKGKQLLLKVENSLDPTGINNSVEKYITFTGEKQHIQFDISDLTYKDQINKVIVFMGPNSIENTSMKVSQFYFTNTELYEGNEYNGDQNDFSINQKFTSNDVGKYTFDTTNSIVKVTSHKVANDDWTFFYTPVRGKLSDFKYIDMEVQGEKDKQILLKVENPDDPNQKKEYYVTLTGQKQHVQFDVSDLSYRDKINKVIVFTTPGSIVNSSIDISKFYFTNTLAYSGNEYTGDQNDFSINQKYISNDAGKYTFATVDSKVKVTSHKVAGDDWVMFYTPVKGKFSDFDYLDMIVQGPVGKEVMVKLENPENLNEKFEQKFILTSANQHIQLDIKGLTFKDKLDKVIVFMTPGTIDNTEMTISTFYFTDTKHQGSNTYSSGDVFHANENWVGNDKYAVDTMKREIKLRKNNDGYPSMVIPVVGDFSSFDYLNITVKGKVGEKVMFKLEECPLESQFVFKDGLTTFTIPLTNSEGAKVNNLNILKQIFIFGEPGNTSQVDMTFNLYDVCFTKQRPTENVYFGEGNFRLLADKWNYGGVYNKNVNGYIAVNKQEDGYPGISYGYTSNETFSKVVIKAKADKDIPIIINANGIEQHVTVGTTLTTTEVNLSNTTLQSLTLMAFPGNVRGSGVIEIVSIELIK